VRPRPKEDSGAEARDVAQTPYDHLRSNTKVEEITQNHYEKDHSRDKVNAGSSSCLTLLALRITILQLQRITILQYYTMIYNIK